MKRYEARPHTGVTDKQAAAVGPVIEQLSAEGNLSPDALWQAAQDPKSPAHNCFTWDKDTAARGFWRIQARRYMRSIVVIVDDSEPEPITVNVRVDGKRKYVLTERAKETPDLMSMVLAQAHRDLRAWRERYDRLRDVAALSGVFAAIDDAAE